MAPQRFVPALDPPLQTTCTNPVLLFNSHVYRHQDGMAQGGPVPIEGRLHLFRAVELRNHYAAHLDALFRGEVHFPRQFLSLLTLASLLHRSNGGIGQVVRRDN